MEFSPPVGIDFEILSILLISDGDSLISAPDDDVIAWERIALFTTSAASGLFEIASPVKALLLNSSLKGRSSWRP
jgi:hypothetical protein